MLCIRIGLLPQTREIRTTATTDDEQHEVIKHSLLAFARHLYAHSYLHLHKPTFEQWFAMLLKRNQIWFQNNETATL